MTKTSKRNQAVINKMKELLISKGYHEDRWGNIKNPDETYRYKFQATSYRYEKKIDTTPPHWMKIGGKYYKDVKI